MDSKKRIYESLEVVDLVLNDDFKSMVFEKGDINLSEFIENSVDHEPKIRLASKIILGLHKKSQFQPFDLKYKLWRQIKNNRRKEKNFAILRYAAVFLLFLSIGSVAYYKINQPQRIVELAKVNPVRYEQFQLIMTDKKNIPLIGNDPIIKSIDNGSTLLINDSIKVSQSKEGYNQVIVPYGRRSKVLLADGTEVNLNSGSRLIYEAQFSSVKKRQVYLEGEGLFKVKKDRKRPFYVYTDKFEIQVLGTTFNVQAYEKENLYNAVLVEGKVNMKLNKGIFSASVELLPSQRASLINNHEQIQVDSVRNLQDYTSWSNGYLEFDNENIEELLKRIAVYYNIKIDLRSNVNQLKINGKLNLMNNPEDIVAGIAAMGEMKYEKEGEQNYIMYK